MTKYIKLEYKSAWEAVKAFEGGEELFTHFAMNGYSKIENIQCVVPSYQVGKIYRKQTQQEIEAQEVEELAIEIHNFINGALDIPSENKKPFGYHSIDAIVNGAVARFVIDNFTRKSND